MYRWMVQPQSYTGAAYMTYARFALRKECHPLQELLKQSQTLAVNILIMLLLHLLHSMCFRAALPAEQRI